jgi:gluconate 5-dehydrogenase
MSDPFRLDGAVALVTGGGSGVGEGISTVLAAAGARVVVAGRRLDVATATAEAVGGVPLALDLADPAALPALVARVEAEVGPVAILVNNGGNHEKAPAAEHPDAAFAALVDVQLTGTFALTREVGRRMLERGTGAITFISSVNARIGMPQVPGYSAAKAGMLGLVGQLAAEWAPGGVRVNAIVSGWIDAGMAPRVLGADAQRRARVTQRIPMGRFGEAEEIGHAVVYLSSPAAAYVTGAALPVDGGALVAL